MSGRRKTALQILDALVCWSRASDIVQYDISNEANERRNSPMRWLPLLPMAVTAGLIYYAITSALPHFLYGLSGSFIMVASGIAINGPLGKSSMEDSEREAELRKNAFFFCLVILAFGNIIASPTFLMCTAWLEWPPERSVGIAFALIIANAAWFISLPTLYASWMSSSDLED